jgi:hypothetical protein
MKELVYSNNKKTVVGITDKQIQHVIIPFGVEIIGENAFENCFNLVSVDIPSSVTTIGNKAFSGCHSLLEVDLPNSINYIGQEAFSCCSSLRIIDMPDSITYLGASAFWGCSKLKRVILPDSIKGIEKGCFAGCRSLEHVEMPKGISIISKSAFQGCDGLDYIEIPDSVRIIDDYAFERAGLYDVEIPDGVLEIGKFAFCDCQGLHDVYLPTSLKTIGNCAFSGTSIRQFDIPQNVESIGDGALDSLFSENISVDVQNHHFKSIDGVLYNGNGDTLIKVPCRFGKTNFSISNKVKCIGKDAFMYTSISEIEIPDSIVMINSGSFIIEKLKAIYSNIRDLDKVQIAQDSFSNAELEEFGFGLKFNSCILYVPSGTRWAYKHHSVFGKFKNIQIKE